MRIALFTVLAALACEPATLTDTSDAPVYYIVDRIEGTIAVVEVSDGRSVVYGHINIPDSGYKEGELLDL